MAAEQKKQDELDDRLDAIAPRLESLLRMLSSTADGEVLNAARLICHVLALAGLDVHDLAHRVGHRGYSENEMQQIHDAAYAKGHADGTAAGRRGAVLLDAATVSAFADGSGVDGHTWREIAEHCERHADRLNEWERNFVVSVAQSLRFRAPSANQANKLRDILRQRFAGRLD